MINAPTGVTRVDTPSQKTNPKVPLLPRAAIERKNKIDPIITFGCDRGILILLSIKANERKIKGKKIVDQPNMVIRKSLTLIKTSPCLEKEIKIKAAAAKKET